MDKKFHEKLRDLVNDDRPVNLAAMLGADSSDMKDILLAIADEIEINYTPKKTCFEAIKEMSFEELGGFIFCVYNKGWTDRGDAVDNEDVFCCTMLEYPDSFLDEDWNEDDE